LPGFGVKVTPKGRKVFLVMYRLAGADPFARRVSTLNGLYALRAQPGKALRYLFLSVLSARGLIERYVQPAKLTAAAAGMAA
jgi:hypothetical protein